jgi:hypothetical protein
MNPACRRRSCHQPAEILPRPRQHPRILHLEHSRRLLPRPDLLSRRYSIRPKREDLHVPSSSTHNGICDIFGVLQRTG